MNVFARRLVLTQRQRELGNGLLHTVNGKFAVEGRGSLYWGSLALVI